MVSQSFTITKKEFDNRFLSVFRHNLCVLMKCYTIRDLQINEIEQSFYFKKTHRINTIKMVDKKEYYGFYETSSIEEEEIILKIMI